MDRKMNPDPKDIAQDWMSVRHSVHQYDGTPLPMENQKKKRQFGRLNGFRVRYSSAMHQWFFS